MAIELGSHQRRVDEAMTADEPVVALCRRLAALEGRVTALEDMREPEIDYGAPFNTNDECRRHVCSYHVHYLMHGGPDLTHEGYHAAEKACDAAQDRYERWLDDHRGRENRFLEERARHWEKTVRA